MMLYVVVVVVLFLLFLLYRYSPQIKAEIRRFKVKMARKRGCRRCPKYSNRTVGDRELVERSNMAPSSRPASLKKSRTSRYTEKLTERTMLNMAMDQSNMGGDKGMTELDYEESLANSQVPTDMVKNHNKFLDDRETLFPTRRTAALQAEPEFQVGKYAGLGRRYTVSNDNSGGYSQMGASDADRANSSWAFNFG